MRLACSLAESFFCSSLDWPADFLLKNFAVNTNPRCARRLSFQSFCPKIWILENAEL